MTENDTETAPRSGWTVSDGDNGPGDDIFLSATIEEMPEGAREVCRYCSSSAHEGAIQERGHIQADYRLVDPYGNPLAYACHACIAETPTRD